MKLNFFLLISILAFLTSCNGQSVTENSKNNTIITPGDTVKELGKNIMTVYQDKRNNYWFGSWETGVYRYDGNTILHYTTKDGLPFNRIDEIKEDKSGNIYFNCCYPGSAITMFNGKTFVSLPVSDNTEWKMLPDDLWFKHSYDSSLIYRYDGRYLYKLQLPKHPNYSIPYAVYSIYMDSKANLWFGTNPLGVCRYNGRTFDWISEEDVTELHNGPANGVRSIIEDKHGNFWFNTLFHYVINDNNSPFYTREKGIGSLDGIKGGRLNEYLSIAKDNDGDLWIVTYADGVWYFDGNNIKKYDVKNGVNNITLFCIYKDNNGSMWLGTHENGVYRFNGRSFERFTL